MENRNYLDEKRNKIIMLIVIGILSAAAILMLYSVPSVLRSNAPTVLGGEGDDVLTGSEGANSLLTDYHSMLFGSNAYSLDGLCYYL
jgi:hypothetical protein